MSLVKSNKRVADHGEVFTPPELRYCGPDGGVENVHREKFGGIQDTVSRLTDLISQVKVRDGELGKELEREFKTLSSRLPFGLNFERHSPESVELPGRPVRKGDKVRILPPRGSTAKCEKRLWRVRRIERVNSARVAHIELANGAEAESCEVPVDDLIVVAEFRDYIYPGLVSTGKVTRGGDKPFHTVINGENFHALEAMTFTHRGKIDAIYIDPPYNSRASDWKYNNDYVEKDDLYRHSKWLAMMERRLLTARELLNPNDSVLIVTIDEKEYLRLGLLLEQTFDGNTMQMISTKINAGGTGRANEFHRVDEYLFVLFFGVASLGRLEADDEEEKGLDWQTFRRRDIASRRGTIKGGPRQFYPIYVNQESGRIEEIGSPLPHELPRETAPVREGCIAVFPIRPDGTEMNWGTVPETCERRWREGYLRAGKATPDEPQQYIVQYLKGGPIGDIEAGLVTITGRNPDGSVNGHYAAATGKVPTTQWSYPSHNSEHYGTGVLTCLLPGRRFPFPKSLYAVQDLLYLFVKEKPSAVILDFFSGSGTTAHSVMRLNKQDGGRRQCISVTNNEVAADEEAALRKAGLRPGDLDWEKWGICDYITKPRIAAAITGKTPEGEPIKGDYKFTDEFPMADGFEENAEFFTLTYETPVAVGHNHSFKRIAPLLWMRAGSTGRRIDELPEKGWDVADTYGLLNDLDHAAAFGEAVKASGTVRIAYVVTDDERRFQSIAQRLPHTVEAVRLYEAYLTNFRFSLGR